MPFVNEPINDEDKKPIDWTKFKLSKFSDPHQTWKWTIDRERDTSVAAIHC